MGITLPQMDQLTSTSQRNDFDNRYLGPATVTKVEGRKALLRVHASFIWATLAFTYAYRPQAGDLVLAISQDDAWYVIGVLEGKGKTVFVSPGDMEFHSPRGEIGFHSAKGIKLRSPKVSIFSEEIGLYAKKLYEKYEHARRWVEKTFDLRSGRTRISVDGTYRLRARNINERAEKDVKIDGEKINLG